MLPKPEKQPFIVTISIGSLLLNIFVQLFSKPQQVEAAKTKREPLLKTKAPFPSKLRIILAIVTKKIAIQSFLDIISLKITNAIIEVATISKLFKSETLAELVIDIPSINKIGAIISKITIAIVYGNSFFVKGSCFFEIPTNFIILVRTINPIPAPKYRKPAIIVVPTCFNNNLDKGIFIEYIEAASNANKVAIFFTFIFIHTFS